MFLKYNTKADFLIFYAGRSPRAPSGGRHRVTFVFSPIYYVCAPPVRDAAGGKYNMGAFAWQQKLYWRTIGVLLQANVGCIVGRMNGRHEQRGDGGSSGEWSVMEDF